MQEGKKWLDLADIFGVSDVVLIEPSYADLPDTRYTSVLISLPADQGRLLIDEESDPLSLAVHTGDDTWAAGCFMLRPPTAPVITRFEELGGELYQECRPIWEASVRAWYSHRIAGEVTPALEDLNPARIGGIRSLIRDLWGEGQGRCCLDFCCGSGLGSLVLRELGYSLLSCDNDASLLSLGFSTRRLLPEETICIDATFAESYIRKTDLGLGLMFGEINRFNTELWEQITGMLVSPTHHSLVTTGTEGEAALVAGWAAERGATTEILENDKDPLYDRWVCAITGP
jgi:hypothetical protein